MKAKQKRIKVLRSIIRDLSQTEDPNEVLRLAALASYQLQDLCAIERIKVETPATETQSHENQETNVHG